MKSFKNLIFVFLCLIVVFPAYAQSQATWSNPWSNNSVLIPNNWTIIPKDAQSSKNQAFTFFNNDGVIIFVSATDKNQNLEAYIDATLNKNNLEQKSIKTENRNNVDVAKLSFYESGLNPHNGDILFGQQDNTNWLVQVSKPIDQLPEASQKLISNIFDSFIIKDNEQRTINLVQTWQNPWTFKSITVPQWWTLQNNISQCAVKFSSYLSNSICINIDKSSASTQQAAMVFAQSKKLDFEQFQAGSIHGISFYASPLTETNNAKTSYIIAKINDDIIFITFSLSDKLKTHDVKQISLILSDVLSTFLPSNFSAEQKTYNFDYNANNTCLINNENLNLTGETNKKDQGTFNINVDKQAFSFENQQANYLWMDISGNIANIQSIMRNNNNLSIQFIDQYGVPYSATYNNLDDNCLSKLRAFFTKADISQIDLGPPKVTND